MNEEVMLREAACWDREAQMVYADWLEEHGQQRKADLVREGRFELAEKIVKVEFSITRNFVVMRRDGNRHALNQADIDLFTEAECAIFQHPQQLEPLTNYSNNNWAAALMVEWGYDLDSEWTSEDYIPYAVFRKFLHVCEECGTTQGPAIRPSICVKCFDRHCKQWHQLCQNASRYLAGVCYLSVFKEGGILATYDPPDYSDQLSAVLLYDNGKCEFHHFIGIEEDAHFNKSMECFAKRAKELR